jgi:hypothetical protein
LHGQSSDAWLWPASEYRLWPAWQVEDSPFEPSQELIDIGFTGRYANYTGADTWYPSWASDGHLYSPFTDGWVQGVHSWSQGENATTGHARIVGDDPMDLRIDNVGVHTASSLPYGGRYPAGSLVHDGVWYYGTYCLDETDKGLNWDVLGPFVGFRWSTDYGRTWQDTPHSPSSPMFPEPDPQTGKVRIGAPKFVDFGRNMEHSPDGMAYLVAHGSDATLPEVADADLSWITGHQIFLMRVVPSIETINDPGAYEFFAGHDRSGNALWTRQFDQMRPIAQWHNNMGCVTITYNAPLEKYLMCVTDGGNTIGKYNTYILDGEDPLPVAVLVERRFSVLNGFQVDAIRARWWANSGHLIGCGSESYHYCFSFCWRRISCGWRVSCFCLPRGKSPRW